MDPESLPLRDIHLPVEVAWWPPAWGWWLAAMIAVLLCVVTVISLVRWRRHRPVRRALSELERARQLCQSGQPGEAVQRVSMLLRRFAITVAGPPMAGLTGREWLAWLDSRWARSGFSAGPGQVLLTGPYQAPQTVSAEAAVDLLALAQAWLREQRLGARP